MTSQPLFLDGHSTTPLAPEARDAMFDVWSQTGNPSSPHRHGETAARRIAIARGELADLIGASPQEIVFTSGATEANNIAILGVARQALASGSTRRRIAVSATEHKSVLEAARALETEGFAIDVVPVERDGRLNLRTLSAMVGPSTLLVSVMAANNETGVLQDIPAIARAAHAAGALIHTDAAQAVGKIDVDVLDWDVDYLTVSGHKMYGPAGIGALFIAAGTVRPMPLVFGGGQQQGTRPGTESTALIAGLGAAARLAAGRLEGDREHASVLVDRLKAGLAERQVRFTLTAGAAPVLPGSVGLTIADCDSEILVQYISRHISISTGSACDAGQILPSHVLRAMSLTELEIKGTVRIYCSRYNTKEDIDVAVDAIADGLTQSRLATGGDPQ